MKTHKNDFRTWVRYIWMQCRDERHFYGVSPITEKEYFQKYKFWLKREYKYRKNINTLYE